jgi:acylphosphatase
MSTLRVRITGRVQGVGFRAWTAETAHGLGLDGWVRNCADGSVEAMISGEDAAVERMLGLCRQGPSAARVARMESESSAEPAEPGFRMLPTA